MKKFHWPHKLNNSLAYNYILNSSLKTNHFCPFEEIYIFSNCGHLGWRSELSDRNLKGDHPSIIFAKFSLIWLIGSRRENFQMIFIYFSLICTFLSKNDKMQNVLTKKCSVYMLHWLKCNYCLFCGKLWLYLLWDNALPLCSINRNSSHVGLLEWSLKIFSSETIGPISNKVGLNHP